MIKEQREAFVERAASETNTLLDVLDDIQKETDTDEERGEPVEEKLASTITCVWKKPLSKEKYIDKFKNVKFLPMLTSRSKNVTKKFGKTFSLPIKKLKI